MFYQFFFLLQPTLHFLLPNWHMVEPLMVLTSLTCLLVKAAEQFINTELKFSNKAFSVCPKLRKQSIYIMKPTFQEEKLRQREVIQLASEPASFTVIYPGSTGTRSQSQPWASGLPTPRMFRKWFTSPALQFRQPGPPFTSCVTMSKLLSPSVPQFSHLENGDNS